MRPAQSTSAAARSLSLAAAGSTASSGTRGVSGGRLSIAGTLRSTAVTVNGGKLSLDGASAISQNTVTRTTRSIVESVTNAISGSTVLTLNGGVATLSQ